MIVIVIASRKNRDKNSDISYEKKKKKRKKEKKEKKKKSRKKRNSAKNTIRKIGRGLSFFETRAFPRYGEMFRLCIARGC